MQQQQTRTLVTTPRPAPPFSSSPSTRGGACRPAALLATAALCAGLLAACGSPDDEQVASVSSPAGAGSSSGASGQDSDLSPQERGQRHVECLRENGLDAPDASADGTVSLVVDPAEDDGGEKVDEDDALRALTACSHLVYEPEGAEDGESWSAEDEKKFTECMRGKGVDWPDPSPDGSSSVTPDDDFGVDERTLHALMMECFE